MGTPAEEGVSPPCLETSEASLMCCPFLLEAGFSGREDFVCYFSLNMAKRKNGHAHFIDEETEA